MKRLLSFTPSSTTSPLSQLSSCVKEAGYFCCVKQTITLTAKGFVLASSKHKAKSPLQVLSWLLLLGSRTDPTSEWKMIADLFKQVNQAQIAVA